MVCIDMGQVLHCSTSTFLVGGAFLCWVCVSYVCLDWGKGVCVRARALMCQSQRHATENMHLGMFLCLSPPTPLGGLQRGSLWLVGPFLSVFQVTAPDSRQLSRVYGAYNWGYWESVLYVPGPNPEERRLWMLWDRTHWNTTAVRSWMNLQDCDIALNLCILGVYNLYQAYAHWLCCYHFSGQASKR